MARGPDFAIAEYIVDKVPGIGTFVQDVIDAGDDPWAITTGLPLVTAGETPERPDDAVIVLMNFGGRNDSFGVQEDHIFEVRSRSASWETAFVRALTISNSLHLAQGSIGGILMRIRSNGPPVPFERDDGPNGGRWLTTQVFTAVLKQGENTTP